LEPLLDERDFEVAVSTFAYTYERCTDLIADTAFVDAFLDQVPATVPERGILNGSLLQALERWAQAHQGGALHGIEPRQVAALDAAGVTPAELAAHPELATATPTVLAAMAGMRRTF
jgi:hypothetical protein